MENLILPVLLTLGVVVAFLLYDIWVNDLWL